MAPLIVATRNDHKLRELREALPGVELEPLPDEVELPPEDGETFEANALGKARAAREATGERRGRRRLRDRGGRARRAPGSAVGPLRRRGRDRRGEPAKLLDEVGAVEDRSVAYVCAIAYVDEDGNEETFEARCEGQLVREPRGDGGFGYDPAFLPDDTGPGDERTMAELSPDEKHAISHRGKAARMLAEHLGADA